MSGYRQENMRPPIAAWSAVLAEGAWLMKWESSAGSAGEEPVQHGHMRFRLHTYTDIFSSALAERIVEVVKMRELLLKLL